MHDTTGEAGLLAAAAAAARSWASEQSYSVAIWKCTLNIFFLSFHQRVFVFIRSFSFLGSSRDVLNEARGDTSDCLDSNQEGQIYVFTLEMTYLDHSCEQSQGAPRLHPQSQSAGLCHNVLLIMSRSCRSIFCLTTAFFIMQAAEQLEKSVSVKERVY